MTPSDPDSSKEQDYDPYELFKKELDLGLEDDFDFDDSPAEPSPEAPFSPSDETLQYRDEDRLYTDEFIRQNEMSSRFLFFSILAASVISIGVGLWYLFAQSQTKPTPQSAPLPVPTQPPIAPLPSLSPILPSPGVPPSTGIPGTTPLPGGAGVVPGGVPTNQPTGTAPTIPPAGLEPPPPPTLPPSGSSGQ